MSLPFVGRSRTLGEVLGLLAHGRGALLTGPAGIGKTRLLQALAESGDPPVERITAAAATSSIPLGALLRFVPPRATARGGLDALTGVRAALVELGDRGVVLGVDDVDRLDAVSAAVLADIVRTGVLIVLCSRVSAAVPEPLRALADEGSMVELALGPLDERDAVTLVRAVAGSVSQRSIRWAVELGEGIPLLLTELARVAPRRRFARVPLTERLGRAVEERLAVLPASAQRIVDLLAYDAPLPLRILVTAVGDAPMREAERHGVVAVGPGPEHLVTLTHPLLAEVVADRLTTVEESTLAATLVAAADGADGAIGAVPDGTVRHARWQVDAGEITKPEVLRDASRELLTRWDPEAAAELARVARQHLPDDPGVPLVLAGAALAIGNHEEADRWYAAVDDHPDATSTQRMQALLGRAEAAYFGLGDERRAMDVLDAADANLPEATQPAAALRAVIALCAGRYPEAEAAGAEVTADAPPDVRLTAAAVAHVAIAASGRLEEAWALTEAMLPLLDDPEVSPEHHFRFATGRQYLRLQLGAIDEMRREGPAETAAERLRLVASDFNRAYGELIAGRGDLAREQLLQAEVRLGATDPYGHRPFLACIAAELAALQGRREAALKAATAAAGWHHPHLGWWAWAVPAAAGWAAVADLRPGAAHERLREASAVAADNGDLVHSCCCLVAALRLGAIDVAGDLADTAAGINGRLWPAVAMAAQGLADPVDDEGRLEQGCEALVDMGAVLWGVSLLARGAVADRHVLRMDRAALRQAAAEEHARRLVGLRPFALLQLREGPQSQLTPRQREIATLAAEGLTSREIAERLVVSVRTVENHLARAYETLGIRRRRELRDVLGPIGEDVGESAVG